MIALLQRKPLIPLALLLFTNLLLLSVQVRNQQGRLLIRSLSLVVFTPIASTVHLLTDGITGAVMQYALLYRAQEENLNLRAENARLGVELAQLRGIKALLSHRDGDGTLQRQFLFDTLLAPVIWKSPPFYAHRLVINGGSRHGVRKDDAAIVPEGIVGRVWTTTPFTSEVELITNDGAAAGAMLEVSRLQGVIQGDGSDILRWNFIPNYESVEVGEIVYTSGTDRMYPKGYPIGKVIKSQKGPAVYRDIQVKPFVDYLRLEEIMVVVSE
ncbi:rod shape-determining protein MreC [Acidobacteria bacterium AH-259-D05]|nr:rod shape-determining protein MreC [Acidobacteria bacterium AH-259-D05]